MNLTDPRLIRALRADKVCVLGTDTIYGFSGRARSRSAVEKIYRLKARPPEKPMIILVASLEEVRTFGVKFKKGAEEYLRKVWPGPVSVIVACPQETFAYLHRGTGKLAFRVPKKRALRDLVRAVGPLVSTSANRSGEPVLRALGGIRREFGNGISCVAGRAARNARPSRVVDLSDGTPRILRR